MNKIAGKIKQKENSIWALGLAVFLCAGISIFFDYYYAINDDMVMKDILAGVYTGTPEGRNIQMLFPLSWLISIFYRVARSLPWYGMFLCVCHFGCIFLFTKRLLFFFHKTWTKALAVLLEAGLIVTLLLYELVFVQYTVTSALLASTAAFLFYTTDSSGTVKDFLLRNVGSILLVTVAFQMRTEMLLLLLPFICVAGLCRWACEKPFFTKENAAKYFSVFGGILAGLFLSQGVHMAAHAGEDWQQFNRFFDSRTQLYDFLWQWHPQYDGNETFYTDIGMTANSQRLIENYNFGLDETIDAELLDKINENANARRKEQASFTETLKSALLEYKYRTFHETDMPWNLFVISLYIMVLFCALGNRRLRFVWELACLAVVRTGLWLFILYRGRVLERITHPLYLMEFTILIAFLLVECKSAQKGFAYLRAGIAGVFLVLCLFHIRGSVEKSREEYMWKESVYKEWEVLQAYFRGNTDCFYFMDVYSWTKYTDKMFVNVDNSILNYDIMGGWIVKSPLTEKKYRSFGMVTMEQALLEGSDIYIINKGEDWNWLTGYYADKGIEVSMQKIDSIMIDDKEFLGVYAVTKE